MRSALTLLLLLSGSGLGCAYYNAMWSAERYAKDARRAERRGQTSEARSQWALAAAKAERVALRHPRSKWADDALTLQAEGLARSGACDEAASPIKQVRDAVTDPPLRERVALAEAECALSAKQPLQAEAALKLPLASKDDARRSRAELLAGRAAVLRLDYAAAVRHFERSRESAALPERARALLDAGRHTEAAALISSLTGSEFDGERGDLLARLASAAGPAAASAALDRALKKGRRIPVQEQARLLLADADRRFAHGEYEEAASRYRRAAAVAPAGSNEAGVAAAGEVRVQLTGVREMVELNAVAEELRRLSAAPNGAAAKALLDLVTHASVAGETPATGFRVAELVRDSLDAPALAGRLFLMAADRDTASLYAPKALVAAIAVLPDRRDSLIGVLDRRYATSPYTRAFHGEPSVAYAAAEDSLARELGLEIGAAPVVGAMRRVDLPIPGPRGPQLDDLPGLDRGRPGSQPTANARPGVPPPPPDRNRP
ncbi:MAG TPA: hypothetical protein VFM23_04285 [Gemmatimonadales bacterium]|nr:hypothetical protein [Gemmatimonadales bacterium]